MRLQQPATSQPESCSTSTTRPSLQPGSSTPAPLVGQKHGRAPGDTPAEVKRPKVPAGEPIESGTEVEPGRPLSHSQTLPDFPPAQNPAGESSGSRTAHTSRPTGDLFDDDVDTARDFEFRGRFRRRSTRPRLQLESERSLTELEGGEPMDLGTGDDDITQTIEGEEETQELSLLETETAEGLDQTDPDSVTRVMNRRLGSEVPSRRPGEQLWNPPAAENSKPNAIFNAIQKPSNWTEAANQALNDVLNGAISKNKKRKFGLILEDLFPGPLYVPSRLARLPLIKEDQDGPYESCKKDHKLCWGLKIFTDDTAPPTGKFNSGTAVPRMNFTRNSHGYYWEAVYRPSRGPGGDDDDDMTGGDDGFAT